MSRDRGLVATAEVAVAVRRQRELKRMSRAELADVACRTYGRDVASASTIEKIETRRPVAPHRYYPTLALLGLHPAPSSEGPGPGQSAGDWVRDLRETYGIAPDSFREHAVFPPSRNAKSAPRRLGRTSLREIEGGKLPRWSQLDALAAAFAAHGLGELTAERLESALFAERPDASIETWEPEVLARKSDLHDAAATLADGALAAAGAGWLRRLSVEALMQKHQSLFSAEELDRARTRIEQFEDLARDYRDGRQRRAP